MSDPTPELVGIIVSGVAAGVVLVVVVVIITVYCYRAIDRTDSKKLIGKKRRLRFVESTGYRPESYYYGDTASSIGTSARLVPPYHIPILYGYPGVDGQYSAATTLEKKTKHQKVYVNHKHNKRRYGEREGQLDFDEERVGGTPVLSRADNTILHSSPPLDEGEEPVIVTYLEDPKDPLEETHVKRLSDDEATTTAVQTQTSPVLADPDNGERTPSTESDGEEGSENYRHRQREPPKGDIGPPERHLISTKGEAVLY